MISRFALDRSGIIDTRDRKKCVRHDRIHIGYQFRPQLWAAGLEMTWIGIIVAVVTYGLGLAFGSLG
jgi:hypothetical protein